MAVLQGAGVESISKASLPSGIRGFHYSVDDGPYTINYLEGDLDRDAGTLGSPRDPRDHPGVAGIPACRRSHRYESGLRKIYCASEDGPLFWHPIDRREGR